MNNPTYGGTTPNNPFYANVSEDYWDRETPP